MGPAGSGNAGAGAPRPAHHLVRYVQHVRRELLRAIEGMEVADLERRVGGINSVAWMVGHLAWQEQAYWLLARGEPAATPVDLQLLASGRPRAETIPAFDELLEAWRQVTTTADAWLVTLDADDLLRHLEGRKLYELENVGTLLTRVIGHYYLHIGQITAVRKLLDLPVPAFVGSQVGAYFDGT